MRGNDARWLSAHRMIFWCAAGIIKLLVENQRMKVDVNVGAADRTKIRLSSKLLALARSVVDLPDPAGN